VNELPPQSFIELVRIRTDIVILISESVAIEPRYGGRLYKCACPFHDDNGQSVVVSPSRQTYKCFGCGEGGDCFSFLMKINNIEYSEALEALARRAGLSNEM